MSIDKFGRSVKRHRNDSFFKLTLFGDLDCGGRKITNIDEPERDNDAVTKLYLKNFGLDVQNKLDEMRESVKKQNDEAQQIVMLEIHTIVDEMQILDNNLRMNMKNLEDQNEHKLSLQRERIKANILDDITNTMDTHKKDIIVSGENMSTHVQNLINKNHHQTNENLLDLFEQYETKAKGIIEAGIRAQLESVKIDLLQTIRLETSKMFRDGKNMFIRTILDEVEKRIKIKD